jgi:hypothetical protein
MTNGTPCRKCGAPIVFLKTAKGNQMPVNADSVSPGDALVDLKKHKSHFATCPAASSFRKRDNQIRKPKEVEVPA